VRPTTGDTGEWRPAPVHHTHMNQQTLKDLFETNVSTSFCFVHERLTTRYINYPLHALFTHRMNCTLLTMWIVTQYFTHVIKSAFTSKRLHKNYTHIDSTQLTCRYLVMDNTHTALDNKRTLSHCSKFIRYLKYLKSKSLVWRSVFFYPVLCNCNWKMNYSWNCNWKWITA